MYGFVFFQNQDLKRNFTESFITVHKQVNPFVNEGIVYESVGVDDVHAILYKPQDSEALPLLTNAIDPAYFVLFWGELFGFDGNPSREILRRLHQREEITNLNGNYSIIVWNRHTKTITVTSDFIGRRKLYYTQNEEITAFSNLDHMLIPFLTDPLQYDEVSLTSSLFFDWSLQGTSFIKKIHTSHPDRYMVFHRGDCHETEVFYNLHQKESRIEDVHQGFLRSLSERIGAGEEVHFDLTAGLDTRTVLALLLELKGIKMTAWTLGTSGTDYEVARKLAQKYGVDHKISSSSLADGTEFMKHAEYLSYVMNGDTNTLRAVNRINRDVGRSIPKVIGIYGTTMLGKNVPGLSSVEAFKKSTFTNKHAVVLNDDTLAQKLRERFESYVDSLQKAYPDMYEEIYYFRERCGVWGRVVFDSTWDNHHITPFEDVFTLQKGLSLPKSIRYRTKSQHYILRKTSPYLYWYPINDNVFNNDYTSFLPDEWSKTLRKFIDRVHGKLNRIFLHNQSDIFTLRKNTFNEFYPRLIKPLLCEDNSITQNLIGKKYLDALSGPLINDNEGSLIRAQLYSIELWRKVCEGMREFK
jgi:hypothetical protein